MEANTDLNLTPQDPDAPASHLVGTAGGAVGGAIAGAAIGTVGGPLGTAIGATVGAIAGGFAGKAVAERAHPTEEPAQPSVVDSTLTEATNASGAAPSYDAIATRAYYIWEAKGRGDGHAWEDWLQSEHTLQAGR